MHLAHRLLPLLALALLVHSTFAAPMNPDGYGHTEGSKDGKYRGVKDFKAGYYAPIKGMYKQRTEQRTDRKDQYLGKTMVADKAETPKEMLQRTRKIATIFRDRQDDEGSSRRPVQFMDFKNVETMSPSNRHSLQRGPSRSNADRSPVSSSKGHDVGSSHSDFTARYTRDFDLNKLSKDAEEELKNVVSHFHLR